MYICMSMLALKKWFRTESEVHMHVLLHVLLAITFFSLSRRVHHIICLLRLQYYPFFLKQPPYGLPTKLREHCPSPAVGIL